MNSEPDASAFRLTSRQGGGGDPRFEVAPDPWRPSPGASAKPLRPATPSLTDKLVAMTDTLGTLTDRI